MTNETTPLRIWQKKAKRRLFFTEEHARFTLRDWLVMLAVTIVYAVFAFTNLGAHEIASTYYAMDDTGEEISVQFEKPEDIAYIKYFSSFGTAKLSFEYSLDGEGYEQYMGEVEEKDENGDTIRTMSAQIIDHAATDMYEWQFIELYSQDDTEGSADETTDTAADSQHQLGIKAQYITIHVDQGGLRVLEMAFCDSTGAPVKIASVKSLSPNAKPGNDVAKMFDEQQFVPKQTYYMTEMYFDEVYHARTAYEYINHRSIYEITHPPLGKNLLSLGIYFFGMNPFGWRFMGALFGVLMLPLMYVFAKKIFKKTLFAFIPTFLMAVDFMHYTQTRIATIDSYSIFFIMLTYLFMYLYSERNYNREPLINTLWPLSLSGVAFGLGAATKWLCIYAGAGLAVLLFIQLVKRYREYAFARQTLADETQSAALSGERRIYLEDISRGYIRRTFITLLWCVVFFIIVPLGIYISAYAPYLAPATDSTGYLVRYAFFAFAGLLILGLSVMWLLKLKGDHRAAVKETQEAAQHAETAEAVMPDAETAQAVLTGAEAPETDEPLHAEKRDKLDRKFAMKRALAIALCVMTLATAGLFIYYTSFVLYTDVDQGSYDATDILHNQEYMFNYHSQLNPDHVHPFSSKWYTWPVDYRPVFFFQGHGYTDGTMSSMSTMGNPAVWWGGVAAVIALIVIRIRKGPFGKRTFFIAVAALSQFLPYILISREMFIYHYFATVPFLILLMTVMAKYMIERTKTGKRWVFVYLGVCLVLFVMFYPVTTGTVVSKTYSDIFLRWLPSWPFY